MKRTILVDGMFCIYGEKFNVNKKLLDIINSFNANKILVVNGFKEKGKKTLEGNGFEAFSLEEQKIKKNNPEYFKTLLAKYKLKPQDVIYFDHDEDSVETAKNLGIISIHYKNDEEIKVFIEKNLFNK